MSVLFHVYLEDYEAELWFDNKGDYLYGWACNDANWRGEYMNPLMERLGFSVVSVFAANEYPEIYWKAYDMAAEFWGTIDSGDEQEDHY
jgi:hypothetical protein